MMSARIVEGDFKRDISVIEQKRQALEQVVVITRAIENLQESLTAVLVLGVASKALPEDALKLYESLSLNLRDLPVAKIKEYYNNLEIIVRKQLNRILSYSGVDFLEDKEVEFITLSSSKDQQSPLEMLSAFKRTAQAAVSLRVLLRKRGVSTPGSPLPASPQVLHQHLNHLEQHEQQQRGRIRGKIEEIKQNLDGMLANPAYPDGMKAMLREVQGNLDQDLRQLKRGASVERLSFVFETQSIVAEPPKGAELEAIALESVRLPPPEKPAGFSKTAARWLNSPWEIGWKDMKGS